MGTTNPEGGAMFTPSRGALIAALHSEVKAGHGGDTTFETTCRPQTDVKMFVASPCTGLTLDPAIGDPVGRV